MITIQIIQIIQHIIMMNTLPLEIISIIFEYILKITDKRQFTQTCKQYNNITKGIIENIRIPNKIGNYILNCYGYGVEKFTYELFHDSYINLMPMKYINSKNRVIIDVLTMNGNMNLLQLAVDKGCNCYLSEYHSEMAIKFGHLDVLKFFIKHGSIWITQFSITAATHGQLDIIIWARKNNFPLYPNHMYNVAVNHGHLDILKWLANNCGTDINSCYHAILHNHLDILIWMKSMGCPLNKGYYKLAKEKGYNDIVLWLENNGCPK